MRLNQANLTKIKPAVALPSYNRSVLLPAVAHIGLGHFHRAHQAYYLDKLLNAGVAKAGIAEYNIVPDRLPVADIMTRQNCLYTLMTKAADGATDVRVVGSIVSYANVAGKTSDAAKKIAGEPTAVVTLTVTEKGYAQNDAGTDVNWTQPDIVWDLAHPDEPRSSIGFVALVLAERQRAGGQPLTIMSCDNFSQNGKTLRRSVLDFCKRTRPDIVDWIEDNVAFPCAMVDRITPNTSPDVARELAEKYGIEDEWPVRAEDFIQWVLESDFRLPKNAAFDPRLFEQAGVQLVADVEPYELMKQRLLNGSHSMLAYLGYLAGFRDVAGAITDPDINRFVRRGYMEEAGTTLLPVPGIAVTAYKDKLLDRFSNRNIGDTILRLCEDGSKKLPNFCMKPLAAVIKQGGTGDAITLGLAGWARFLSGTDEAGEPIPIQDPAGSGLLPLAKNALAEPRKFLEAAGMNGLDENEVNALADRFKARLQALYKDGAKKVLRGFCAAHAN